MFAFVRVALASYLSLTVGTLVSGLPAVVLDSGTFTGFTDGVTNQFLGIPYAKPPYVISQHRLCAL